MKLERIIIKNFRRIAEATIDFAPSTFIIGPNNCGKTTVIDAIDKLRDTATSHDRVFFVEVMGRDAGFIALNSGIASGAQDILIPEQRDSVEELCSSLERSEKSGKKFSSQNLYFHYFSPRRS